VALDMKAGRVAVDGWRTLSDEMPVERARRLRPYCSGFLFTNIAHEGMLDGADLELAATLRNEITGSLTFAGGISSIQDIVSLDRIGIDAQVGMAIYTDRIEPEQAFVQTIDFKKGQGLVPTIVCDVAGGKPLMLAYSSPQSLKAALAEGAGIYWSRSRNALWRKGESSSHRQRLVRAAADCDRDSLIFYVEQTGPACHTGEERCFDSTRFAWQDLIARIDQRAGATPGRSFTQRLLADSELLNAKLREEADEVCEAQSVPEVAWECADLLYFMSVKMQRAGVTIADVMAQLGSRAAG
ncbi:MAG: phosphoribosyl-ATP diphosphatase, partial [Candidatus Eremiobacteraeota bacterium]|nr:phosphoribosyl-ATP diphosphatase [Candidatus Eremiobacteraeota bacterium]